VCPEWWLSDPFRFPIHGKRTLLHSECDLLSTLIHPLSVIATMGKNWVLPSFKNVLIDASQEFLDSTDKGKDKARTALITRIAGKIRQAVVQTGDPLPEELEKVCYIIQYSVATPPDWHSPSEHGFRTRPVDMTTTTQVGSPKRMPTVIIIRKSLGLQGLYADTFTRSELWRCRYAYPTMG